MTNEPTAHPMNEREILASVLRWHTAYARRLGIGAQNRRLDKAVKVACETDSFNPYAPNYRDACLVRNAAAGAAQRLTPARREELAALRDLAKVCAKVRTSQNDVVDANVIDLPLLIGNGGIQ